MISWMQKHNKFLVITIWIATISFIFTGATYGFSFGIKSSSIGKTGDIELNRDRFQMEYRNLYNRYNQIFQGKFDEAKAKEMRLQEQVLNSMATQALILNLAKDFGIVVEDREVGERLASIPIFKKDNMFNKNIYMNFLKNHGISAKTFEDSLRDSIIIEKTFSLLNLKGIESEYQTFTTPFEIADKLKYIILSPKDLNITVDEKRLKKFWEVRKDLFKTAKQYSFDMVWVDNREINITNKEIEKYFNENSFKYTDTKGKLLSLDESRPRIIKEIKLKKSKRDANKRYIAFKKGKIQKSETVTYNINDSQLPQKVWREVLSKKVGELLKPKVVGDKYAILKIVNIKEPRVKSFEEAKDELIPIYKDDTSKELMAKLAEDNLKNIDKVDAKISDFITLKNIEKRNLGLNQQEIAELGSKLFTSDQEKGIISIGDKVIVYKVMEQKLISLDENETVGLAPSVDRLKKLSFQSNLMKQLDKKYPTKFYK